MVSGRKDTLEILKASYMIFVQLKGVAEFRPKSEILSGHECWPSKAKGRDVMSKRNRGFIRLMGAGILASSTLGSATSAQALFDGCPSGAILERFVEFGRTGQMPPDLGAWLSTPGTFQRVSPVPLPAMRCTAETSS